MFTLFRKRRENLRMRKYLNEHEADVLMPYLYDCVKVLKDYFEKLKLICKQHENNEVFGLTLLKVLQHDGITLKGAQNKLNPMSISNAYFSNAYDMIDSSYVKKIDKFLVDHSEFPHYDKINDFAVLVRDLNFIVSMVLDIRDKFFIYDMQVWVAKQDPHSLGMIDLIPKEALVIAMPFKSCCENIISVAESIRKNIDNWQKDIIESRSYTLAIKSNRTAVAANILTIVTSLSLAFFFFSLPSYLEKKAMEESISNLLKTNHEIGEDNIKLSEQIIDLEKNIDSLKTHCGSNINKSK